MEQKIYKVTYYLNAKHSFDYIEENIHSHTFNICLYIKELKEQEIINYYKVDTIVNQFFENYDGCNLNEIEPFTTRIPSIENIGGFFYEYFKIIFLEINIDLIQLDISENPLRIYSISDQLL